MLFLSLQPFPGLEGEETMTWQCRKDIQLSSQIHAAQKGTGKCCSLSLPLAEIKGRRRREAPRRKALGPQHRVGAWTEMSWEWHRLAWHTAVAVLLRLQDDTSHTVPWQNKISAWLIYTEVTLELSDSAVNNQILTEENVSPRSFPRVQLPTSETPNFPASSLAIMEALPKS